jgi:xylulokinase
MGLDAFLLPALQTVTEVVGGVTDVAAGATGLRAGTPVIAGTGDTFPTLVGCGAVDAGDAMISLGTTGLLTLTTHRLESAAASPHLVAAFADDTRSTEEEGAVPWSANVLARGQLLAWLREMLGPVVRLPEGDKIDYGSLDRAAVAVPAGCERPLPILPHAGSCSV